MQQNDWKSFRSKASHARTKPSNARVDRGPMTKTALVLLALAGCTKPADRCMSDSDCTDPAYPFCDITGTYPASDGDKDVCTIAPPTDAGVDAPAQCAAGSVLSCAGSMELESGANGMMVMVTCPLGCSADGMRCTTFDPSYGVGSAFQDASTQSDV